MKRTCSNCSHGMTTGVLFGMPIVTCSIYPDETLGLVRQGECPMWMAKEADDDT